jgi:hypothetical protein
MAGTAGMEVTPAAVASACNAAAVAEWEFAVEVTVGTAVVTVTAGTSDGIRAPAHI